jgi:predicted metal-dependent hydrolase
VVVKAPVFLSNGEIDRFVCQKENWIRKKREEILNRNQSAPKVSYVDGEKILYQGVYYTLQIEINPALKKGRIKANLEEKKILMELAFEEENRREILLSWYVHMAGNVIAERVAYHQAFVKENINRITIKDQKTRWGSCSTRHNLNFNWRLILAKPEILDYVVVHEMCHLLHMDHSKEFWREVERILPDYRTSENWLKENGSTLFAYM